MRKIILYIASSMDGKIATTNGGVKWLESIPNPEKTDYGYAEFYGSIDTTIMGYGTYQQLMSWNIPFPYKGKKNYVVTNRKEPLKSEYVEFISSDLIEHFHNIKQQKGSDIWLIGGGKTNALLLKHRLLDEIRLFVMPVVLNEGIDIFDHSGDPFQSKLDLIASQSHPNGVLENKYAIKYSEPLTK